MLMDRLDAMRLFVRVVETGSFSAVAREANIGQPAVSKQIAALEEHLRAQLLHRTSRNLSLTEAGQIYYEAAVRLLSDLDDAEQAVGRGQTQPSGLLRVTLSAGFGRLVVVPLLPSFHARYPEIVADLIVSDRYVDLVEDGIDVAIRLGELEDSSVIARRIGVSPRVTVATPAYLERTGAPATPHDLDRHACVAFTFQRRQRDWVFLGPDGPIKHAPKGLVRANDAENIRAAVLAGVGLAQAPRWLFAAELINGDVCEVLSDYPAERPPIHAIFPPGRKPASRVRVFIDHLAEAFAQNPCLN
jgi:LysR family transcriptional regulator for bpeEF and oprC